MRILAVPESARTMGEAGLARSKHFTWTAVSARLVRALRGRPPADPLASGDDGTNSR
jgi:hypothetical protein